MTFQLDLFGIAMKDAVKVIGPVLYIPSSSIAESENISLSALVQRQASRWRCGHNSYYSTEFSFSDILEEGEFQLDAITEPTKTLTSYNGSSTWRCGGILSGGLRNLCNAGLKSSSSVTIAANLQTLSITEIDIQKLLGELRDRKLNMQHELVREVQAEERRALCIVTAVVKTTAPTIVTSKLNRKFEGNIEGTISKVGVDAGVEIYADGSRVLHLPAGTTLAYQVAELSVHTDGGVIVMVLSGAEGGFQSNNGDNIPPAFALHMCY